MSVGDRTRSKNSAVQELAQGLEARLWKLEAALENSRAGCLNPKKGSGSQRINRRGQTKAEG